MSGQWSYRTVRVNFGDTEKGTPRSPEYNWNVSFRDGSGLVDWDVIPGSHSQGRGPGPRPRLHRKPLSATLAPRLGGRRDGACHRLPKTEQAQPRTHPPARQGPRPASPPGRAPAPPARRWRPPGGAAAAE